MDITQATGAQIDTKLGTLDIIKFLGKGKSGYSYLATNGSQQVVLKFMHDEPCPYYDFGDANKVELEAEAYQNLKDLGIRIPELLELNPEAGYLLKQYIDGHVATDLIVAKQLPENCIEQLCQMFVTLRQHGLNIDYFPENFVYSQGLLYYIDYERNLYDPQWDLAEWGLYYWANAEGVKAYRETGDIGHIHDDLEESKPRKQGFTDIVEGWLNAYVTA